MDSLHLQKKNRKDNNMKMVYMYIHVNKMIVDHSKLKL